MRAIVFLLASSFLLANARAQTDPFIASVQGKLKEQGFYYGETNGKKDADTTAAIRRFQIRNGLQITGELSAETQKSLGVKGPIPAPAATPPAARMTPAPARVELRPAPPREETPMPAPTAEFSGIFNGTPYESATIDVQARIIAGAQSVLAQRGYYRDLIDGVFGPGTEFALRAYQARFGMVADGRLNKQTLAAMGLLPGQRAPGVTAPQRRGASRPGTFAPSGEPVYTPR